MNNCQQCNFVNTPNARFCNNCGAPVTNAAPDPPPTVFGAPNQPVNQPDSFQNQPNAFQNQPPNFQNQPDFSAPYEPGFGAQNPPPVSGASKKSVLRKILLIVGGIVALVVVGVFGMFVYDKTLGKYLSDQRYEKQYREKQSKADLLAGKDLLPESITTRTQQTVSRGVMLDKAQLLEVIKTKMPQLNSEAKNISDAAAALYATPDKRQALLQVFKYNSPEQAKNACEEIGREMIKNKDNFVSSPSFGFDFPPGYCGISGDTKTGDHVSVHSLYGFLSVSTGYKEYSEELYSVVRKKLY